MEIRFIKGQEISYLIQNGFGKLVYTTLKHCKNFYISDYNVNLFKVVSEKYYKMIDDSDNERSHKNAKFRRLSREYMSLYEELYELCKKRMKTEYDNAIYASSDGYHLNYNSGFAKKITDILVGY